MGETISWEEAEWTRDQLGLSVTDFARLLGLPSAQVHAGRLRPSSCLPEAAATLLYFAVNRAERSASGRWIWRRE